MSVGGCMGKILVVDLSSGEIKVEAIEDTVYQNVLSGVGLGAYYLYKNIPAGIDPMGEKNVLGFLSGILTGTGTFMTGRFMVMCKSPLTGTIGEANCGGNFAPAIKQCGYDGIFIKGISKTPVYLLVTNKGAELKDASDLWRKEDAVDTEEILIKRHTARKKPGVVAIGEAGETLSLMAGITNDRGRIAARSGVGAVMGSKNLKAVVCVGNKMVPCSELEKQIKYSNAFAEKCKKSVIPIRFNNRLGNVLAFGGYAMSKIKKTSVLDGSSVIMLYKHLGTISANTMSVPSGDTPIKNWGGSVKDFPFKRYKNLSADKYWKREMRKYHCYSCSIGCGGVYDIHDIREKNYAHTHKPEYETVGGFGHFILNDNLEDIFYINELLNRAGIDSIASSHVTSMAIECYEHNLLSGDLFDGVKLGWGDTDSVIWFLKKLIKREGIGEIFADGPQIACEKLGKESLDFGVHVGGQPPAMHDPKMDPLLGVHYVTDPSPGKHTIGMGMMYNTMSLWDEVSWAPKVTAHDLKEEEFIPSEKEALKSVACSAYKLLADSSGACLFGMTCGIKHWNLFTMINNTTGWHLTGDQYMEIGIRINTIRQLFNIKHGIEPKSIVIHPRIKGEPALSRGPVAGVTLRIEEMTKLHWKHYNYDTETGVPKEIEVKRLGLDKLLELEAV